MVTFVLVALTCIVFTAMALAADWIAAYASWVNSFNLRYRGSRPLDVDVFKVRIRYMAALGAVFSGLLCLGALVSVIIRLLL